MPARPVLLNLALLLGTVIAGLAVRFAPLGLPRFIIKYGGSTLWALTIYWVVSTLLTRWPIHTAALLAAAIATAVEFAKLYRCGWLDAFRDTLAGTVLLGRFFSMWDLVAYWLAIAIGALVDQRLRSVDPAETDLSGSARS